MREIVCCTTLLLTAVASGAEYTFTKIADNAPGSRFREFSNNVLLINNNGVVAFTATLRDGGDGVFTGSGGDVRTIFIENADIEDPQATDINDSGTVVFTADRARIFTGNGGTPTLVAQGDISDPLNGASLPSINNGGTVAWSSFRRVYGRTGTEPVRVLVSETEVPRMFAAAPARITGVQINNSGTVAFFASQADFPGECRCGFVTKTLGGQLNVIASDVLAFNPRVNDNGTVPFMVTDKRNVVYTGRGGPASAAVQLPETFGLLPFHLSINNAEKLLFMADNNATSGRLAGLFTGSDFAKDKVVGFNDPLFGSTVIGINPVPSAGRELNDRGQVVFAYTLSNFLSGIAVATPVNTTPPGKPALAASGVVNAASFSAEDSLSPGSVVSLFGSNFAPRLTVAGTPVLPTALEGVRVMVNGAPAPLFFVSPAQINLQIPYEISGATAEIRVAAEHGDSGPVTVRLATHSPAIYSLNQKGNGQGAVFFANTSTLAAETGLTSDSRPARPGDVVTMYLNGLGAVSPPVASGFNSCNAGVCAADLSNMTLRRVTTMPVVEVGGVRVPDGDILFAGLAPQFTGLYQINFRVPTGVRSGLTAVVVRQGAFASREGVVMAVQ